MCFFLTALLLAVAVNGQNPCNLVIAGDFDSECLYSDKTSYTDEYPALMVACENSHVTYTAHATPTLTIVSYTWEVAGDVSHTATGNQLAVDWGDDGWGLLVVTATADDGTTCTATAHVKVIAAPAAGAATVPAYTLNADGDKVIRVCKGSRVEFVDQSTDEGSDIAGYHWQCTYAAPASTPGYVIDAVLMDDKIVHRVYNNCGCYDEETYLIEVLEGSVLQLECFGTVCEGDAAKYSVTDPTCTDYFWHVEGGTLIGGQGTAHPTVQWDCPENGYGVLGLDGVLCGEEVCPSMMSVRVPVIQDRLHIEGPQRVCLGESAVYRLPLFGSTRYDWSVHPPATMESDMAHGNEMRFSFPSAGTYYIDVTYYCEFLDCGPFHSETLVVSVLPDLTIEGQERICVANSCNLHTEPLVSATWQAYDLGNGNVPVGSPSTGSVYSETFSTPGRYLITAESPAHCGPAAFVLTVKEAPPAPSVDDLSPDNRHTACPLGGICLTGTPAEPNYNLVWAPACSTAAPQLYSGDSVNISYSGEVCDVLVYNYDRLLQCRSTNAYVHTVTPLVPTPTTLPTNITVCPNSIVSLHGMVPNQYNDGIRYEWKIEEHKQNRASVRGSHQEPDVTLLVNDLGITTPYSFYVELTRTFCDNYSVTDRVNITVRSYLTATLGISGPSDVCVGGQATFSGSGCTPNHYSWTIDNTPYSGDQASHTFNHTGTSQVYLYCNPYDQCSNPNYLVSTHMSVTVHTPQHLQGIVCSNTTPHVLSLLPDQCSCTGCTFAWYYTPTSGSPNPPLLVGTSCTYQPSAPGIYECRVTDGNGCISSVHCTYPDPNLPWTDMAFSEDSRDYCNGIIQITASPSTYNILWTADGEGTLVAGGTNNCTATISFDDVGTCYAHAEMVHGSTYCRGTAAVTLDFMPAFHLTPACEQIKIHNDSRYLNSAQTVYLDVVNDNTNTHQTVSFPASQKIYYYSLSPAITATTHFTAYLVGYGTNGNVSNCPVAEITLAPPPPLLNVVSITSDNPYSNTQTCNNTPVRLTASLNYPGASIVRTSWSFGDASSYSSDGSAIYHTFEGGGVFNTSVSVTDSRGCERHTTFPIAITSHQDILSAGNLFVNGSPVCPHQNSPNQLIYFSPNPNNSPLNHYTWESPLTDSTFENYVSEPDIYGVSVVSDYFCKKEATTYVQFKPCPTARIYAENFSCCTGQPLPLYGSLEPTPSLQYSWHVTSTSGFSQTFNTGDIVFTPTVSGNYDVALTVTDMNTACASTAHATVTANPQPAPPALAFLADSCIERSPLTLSASGYSGELHWSNGTTGANSLYHTPGFATAYYYDPAIGCPSQEGSIRIHRQPDFDALLTGCYEKCPDFLSSHTLPVYSLTPDSVDWQWQLDNSILSSGIQDVMPLDLPFSVRPGVYRLAVDYQNGGCHTLSPKLSITTKDVCDCVNILVETKVTDMHIKDCIINYTINVYVCNNNTDPFCIDGMTVLSPAANVSVAYDGLTGNTVAGGECSDFTLVLECTQLIPTNALLLLTDESCLFCTKQFSVDITPDIGCRQTVTDAVVGINLVTDAAAYFDFHMTVPDCNLLALWVEPAMVVSHNYGSGGIDGLWMLDMGVLKQLQADDSQACLHALLCCNDRICLYSFCIDAGKLIQNITTPLRSNTNDY